MIERTFVIIKPDSFARGLSGEILRRFETKGFAIKAMRAMTVSRQTAEQHYAEHAAKPFFSELVDFLISGPVIVLVLEGEKAIEVVRRMIGKTDPAESEPGSIRGDFAIEIGRNAVHGSDSLESAAREIKLYFGDNDFV